MHKDGIATGTDYGKGQAWGNLLSCLQGLVLETGRQQKIDQLLKHDFPHRRMEQWKYSDLKWLSKLVFTPALPVSEQQIEDYLTQVLNEAIRDFPRLVVVNGEINPRFSTLSDHEVYCFKADTDTVFGDISQPEQDSMTALNLAMNETVFTLQIPEGQDAGTMLIVNIGHAGAGEVLSFHPKYKITLAQNANLSLIEMDVGQGNYFSNPVYEVQLASHSRFNHTYLNLGSKEGSLCSNSYVTLKDHADYQRFLMNKGSFFARHELSIALQGEWSHAGFDAVQILFDRQHADITSRMTHQVPHCRSDQNVKNILSDRSHGVFQGKVLVEREAQKTDAQQQNQALLLSDHAEIDTKPELEIYADDVKCSHGAAIGALDQEQLFFLMARGIPEAKAKQMLIQAFVMESIEKIQDPIVQDLLSQHLNF